MKDTCLRMFGLIAICAVAVSPALAAKGGGKGGGNKPSTSTLNIILHTDVDGDGVMSQGDMITFGVSTTATTEPHIQVACTQNGVVVFGAGTGLYATYPWPWTQIMGLASTMWQSGGADCRALLQAYEGTRVITLTTVNFVVAP